MFEVVEEVFSAVPRFDNLSFTVSDALTGDPRFVHTVALVKL